MQGIQMVAVASSKEIMCSDSENELFTALEIPWRVRREVYLGTAKVSLLSIVNVYLSP
jgi:hypothetical protein